MTPTQSNMPAGGDLGTCPECGKPLVQKSGKFGPFIGCSGYPQCRYIQRDAGSGARGSGRGAQGAGGREQGAGTRARTERSAGTTGARPGTGVPAVPVPPEPPDMPPMPEDFAFAGEEPGEAFESLGTFEPPDLSGMPEPPEPPEEPGTGIRAQGSGIRTERTPSDLIPET